MIKFDKQKLQTAISQTFALNVGLNGDEKCGAKWFSAITKAQVLLEENFAIGFDGVKLTFVSFDSFKTRIVTKDGCSSQCECGNQVSYHKALFEIVERYSELAKQRQANAQTIETPKPAENLASRDKNAPYLKIPTGRKPEKIGNYRI